MNHIRKENFVWMIPPAGVFILTVVVLVFESCMGTGYPIPPREPIVTLQSLEQSIATAQRIYYLTLFVGGVFSVFIYYQVWRLTKKLRRLGHNV